MEVNQIYCGDCAEILSQFPDNIIDLSLVSPPYDNIRDYKGYKFNFEETAKQIFRVTKEGGVLVWVVNDSFVDGNKTLTSHKQALYFKEVGFRVHDLIYYEKHNFANPSKTRYHQLIEQMYVFSKGKPKTFNPIRDKKIVYAGGTNWGKNTVREKDGTLSLREKRIYGEWGMRTNIWRYITGKQSKDTKIAYKHPAPFPIELARDHIISWSNENDLVMDCMSGSGTALKAARDLNRNFIGCDISKEYVVLSRERLGLI